MKFKSENQPAFNKDLSKLMELQRIEIISNNFAIEGKHEERVRALKRWYGMIRGLLLKLDRQKEIKKIKELIEKCRPVKIQGNPHYDVSTIDTLHDYLNIMNVMCHIEFTDSKKDDFLAPEEDWT